MKTKEQISEQTVPAKKKSVLTYDQWNPSQYDRFKDQRSMPFFDLVDWVKPGTFNLVMDLGCGTGEWTKHLHQKLKSAKTIGIDTSPNMLLKAEFHRAPGLSFENGDISKLELCPKSVDLLFSNAALQWVPNHESILPKLLQCVSDSGQVAIQMPANNDHVSHTIAARVASDYFPEIFESNPIQTTGPRTLGLERYAEILHDHGFKEQNAIIKVYGHEMNSGQDVVEWTKGTLLTSYQKQIDPDDFKKFVKIYTDELLKVIGKGPYFYAFKRILLWGKKSE